MQMCVFAALAFLVVLIFSRDVHGKGFLHEMLTETADLKPRAYGWWLTLFLAQRNRIFGHENEHAFRGAVVFAIYAFPFFLPQDLLPTALATIIQNGVYSNFIGQMFLFSYQKTVGQTMASTAQLMTGTMIAVLTIWLLFGFYPTGVSQDTTGHVYMVGITSGASLVLFMLFLNFPLKVSIFCLARFADYWMAFLNPDPAAAASYSVGFTIKFTGVAMKAFTATVIGSFLALVANLLPYPELSLLKAEHETFLVLGKLKDGWKTFSAFIALPEKQEDMMSKMQRELFEIKAAVDSCNSHIETSWWECLGIGKRQTVRKRLHAISCGNMEMYTQLLGALQCCTADDTFSPQHVEIMSRMASVNFLLEAIGELLFRIAKFTREPSPEYMKRSMQQVSEAALALTRDFLEAKKDLRIAHVDEEYFEEHVIFRAMCVFAHRTCAIAQELLDDFDGEQIINVPYNGPDILSVFNMNEICTAQHALSAVRFSTSFFLVFGIGYFGKEGVIDPLNASLAANMALLMSPGHGLQLTKNMMRLQGVVLGTAIGVMLHVLVSTCSAQSTVEAIFLLTIWIWFNLIGHFSDKSYSYLCFLLAIFGQNNLVLPCGADQAPAQFTLVFSIVMTIAVMTFVDMVTPCDPPSRLATHALEDAWLRVEYGFRDFFQVGEEKPGRETGTILSVIVQAISLHQEAEQEPRFWKTEWRGQSFDACITLLRLLRASLRTIEDCRPSSSSPRPSSFVESLKLSSLSTLLNIVETDMAEQRQLMKVFLHEETSDIEELDHAVGHQIDGDLQKAVAIFSKDVSALDLPTNLTQTLDTDSATRVCHIIACFYSMRKALKKFKSTIVVNG
jgi:hypothetical protein